MRRTTRGALALAALALAGWLGGSPGGEARAEDRDGDEADARDAPAGRDAAKEEAPPVSATGTSRLTVYVPPSRGAVGARTGGGTRGPADAPRIAVLAPDHVGLTTRAQPVLAWYLSRDTDLAVVFTVIADDGVEPLAEAPLPTPLRAGIHLVDLAALGVELERDAIYDWSVSLVLDPEARDADVVAGGAVARSAATPELDSALAGPGPAYRTLARHGIWYDAIADLSARIAATPDDAALRAERAALLEQVGVAAAAAFDREEGDGPAPTAN